MLILEFIATAVDGSEIVALTAVLVELTFKEVFPVRVFKDVESLLLRRIRQEQFETSYDVMAEEMPYFRTLNYTEHAGTMIVHPLNSMLRVWQMEQAFFNDDDSEVLDYAGYIKSRVEAGQGNKYQDRENFFDKYPPRKHIVILASLFTLSKNNLVSSAKDI